MAVITAPRAPYNPVSHFADVLRSEFWKLRTVRSTYWSLGAVIRSSAGAVATLFGVLFVPSLIVTLLPQSWQDTVGRYLPIVAGETIITVRHQAHTLQPWPGFGVFCLYAAAALAAGIVLISRRDA